jgi:POTRA domain, FtsQ-type/Cell division protein FtsQ
VRRKVATLPWVGTVAVERHWPSGLTIRITERRPLAQMTGPAGQTVVVDDHGRVLALQRAAVAGAPDGLGGDLPLVRIVGGAPAGAPGTSVQAAAGGALALVRALSSPGSDRRLTVVTQAPDGALHATLSPGPIEVVFGSVDDIGAKLVAARSLMAGLAPGTSATVDVRVVDAPVLTNEKNSSMVSTTQRG